MDKNKLKEVSNSLKFEANDEVVKQIEGIYSELEQKIKLLKNINTDNVQPMTRVDNTPISFLREDTVGEPLKKELILQNAPKSDKDFVVIGEEVSND